MATTEDIMREHDRTITERALCAALVAAGAALLCAATPARALTTASCEALRLKAWGTLRQCQRNEDAKTVLGKPANPENCVVRYAKKVRPLRERAAAAGIPCRFRDNGDNTVTDLDTGLMWIKLTGLDGIPQPFILDVDDRFDWHRTIAVGAALGGASNADQIGLIPFPGNALYDDWRMPSILEVESLVDPTASGCGTGSACIDPIFEPNRVDLYWTSSTWRDDSGFGWAVNFFSGGIAIRSKAEPHFARAVRRGL